MGPRGAVNILYDDAIVAAEDPEAKREELIAEYREEFANPYTAADRGFVDAVIEPTETRPRLIRDLEVHRGKRERHPEKKHGNLPI